MLKVVSILSKEWFYGSFSGSYESVNLVLEELRKLTGAEDINVKINCCYIIKISLIAASLAWFYHLCNGIRHLFWDMGYGFAVKSVNLSGWTVVICSTLFTILLWV